MHLIQRIYFISATAIYGRDLAMSVAPCILSVIIFSRAYFSMEWCQSGTKIMVISYLPSKIKLGGRSVAFMRYRRTKPVSVFDTKVKQLYPQSFQSSFFAKYCNTWQFFVIFDNFRHHSTNPESLVPFHQIPLSEWVEMSCSDTSLKM